MNSNNTKIPILAPLALGLFMVGAANGQVLLLEGLGASNLRLGETVAVTIRVDNSMTASTATIGWNDILPAGLVVAAQPPNPFNACNGTLTAFPERHPSLTPEEASALDSVATSSCYCRGQPLASSPILL